VSDTPETKTAEGDSTDNVTSQTDASGHSQVRESSEDATSQRPEAPPPASISTLFSMLTTQALVAMGQLAIPGEEPSLRLDYAKYYIDLLDVLEEKTRRNLLGHEADLLKSSLFQLRMLYVESTKPTSKSS
jgi:Domain of unknown function (DUF1844)